MSDAGARLSQQRRLIYENFPADWDRYSLTEVVHCPQDLSAAEWSEVLRTCMKRIYSMPVLKAKTMQTYRVTGRGDAAEFAWQANLTYREIAVASTTFAAS